MQPNIFELDVKQFGTAADLGVSINTVRTHVMGIYQKLSVHSVSKAVGKAIREQIV